eukprot:7785510-Prorocentrum_lima.AAC.1
MTSSLVGSEMCIRDRTSTTSAAIHTQWRYAQPQTIAPLVVFGCPSAAVSYTHLTLPTICSV